MQSIAEEKMNSVMEQELTLCINCAATIELNFCGNCGQPKKVERLSFKTLAGDIYSQLLSMDNKFARTIWYLLVNPKYVIQGFINGNRTKFFGAGGMYFLLLTIYLLLLSFLDISLTEVTASTSEYLSGANTTQGQQELQKMVEQSIYGNIKIFTFLTIPFFAWGLLIVFRKNKLNFFEHAIVIFYSFSLSTCFSILAALLYKITDVDLFWTSSILVICIFSYIAARYYDTKWWRGLLKGLAGYLLGYLMIMAMSGIATILYLILNPELVESLSK